MLKNYIKIAFRNLLRNKTFSFINIFGLAIGIAGSLLILMFISEELSFDSFHAKANRIYKVNYIGNLGGDDYNIEGTPPPLAGTLMSDFPEVEYATRIYPYQGSIVKYGEKEFLEKNIMGVDSNFFKIFSFEVVDGKVSSFFQNPNSIVLTESIGKKYFKNENPIGKTIFLGPDKKAFTVQGIVKDPPTNSHFTFDLLTPIQSYQTLKDFEWSWIYCSVITYIQLKADTSPKLLQAKFSAMIQQYAGGTVKRIFQSDMKEFEKSGKGIQLYLQPLKDIHLHSAGIDGGFSKTGDFKNLLILSAVALLIIILACINFMNLSTARSSIRAKEVGVRKVLGSYKRQLIFQFLTESVMVTGIGLFMAFGLVELYILTFKNTLFQTSSAFIYQPWVFGVMILLMALLGVIAGSYPAFYLTSFKPVEVLKGKLKAGKSNSYFRDVLVVFQFSITVCLIICAVFIYKQLQYLRDRDLGFNKENLVLIETGNFRNTIKPEFRESLSSIPGVKNASISTGLPPDRYQQELFVPEGAGKEGELIINFIETDENFLSTLKIVLLEGRDFSKTIGSDLTSGAILINEAAAKILGWKNPIGKKLFDMRYEKDHKVVGIVKNFNFTSLHNEIEPLIIMLGHDGELLSVKLNAGDPSKTLKQIEERWKQFEPETPFQYSFLDTTYDLLYKGEERLGSLITGFTGLAIFVACLGLFGLASFTAEQRTREIGIRKVLGASSFQIVNLLSNHVFRLILIANLFAIPAGWYLMTQWLENFAFKIKLDLFSFVLSGLLALIIALLTVSAISLKASLLNPVNSLRNE